MRLTTDELHNLEVIIERLEEGIPKSHDHKKKKRLYKLIKALYEIKAECQGYEEFLDSWYAAFGGRHAS